MHIAIIDNYDSFTFNLVHYMQDYIEKVKVIRYKDITPRECAFYDAICISPGPGHPNEYEMLYQILKQFHKTKPILGICLGHQVIGSFFGADLINMPNVMHGQRLETRLITNSSPLFKEIPAVFFAGRYHSWVLHNIPDELQVIATDANTNEVMAISHRIYNIHGIQFHPESIMTDHGKKIIQNWTESIL